MYKSKSLIEGNSVSILIIYAVKGVSIFLLDSRSTNQLDQQCFRSKTHIDAQRAEILLLCLHSLRAFAGTAQSNIYGI